MSAPPRETPSTSGRVLTVFFWSSCRVSFLEAAESLVGSEEEPDSDAEAECNVVGEGVLRFWLSEEALDWLCVVLAVDTGPPVGVLGSSGTVYLTLAQWPEHNMNEKLLTQKHQEQYNPHH